MKLEYNGRRYVIEHIIQPDSKIDVYYATFLGDKVAILSKKDIIFPGFSDKVVFK